MQRILSILALGLALVLAGESSSNAEEVRHPWSRVSKVFPQDESFFPIGVWVQPAARAGEYKAMGVNYYFGLWGGPTEAQIKQLREHNMGAICGLNEYAQQNLLEDPIVWGWMHQDEPDLAHIFPRDLLKGPEGKNILRKHWPEVLETLEREGKEYDGWGMGANPRDLLADYKRWRELDRLGRPVVLQLSKAVSTEGREMGRGDHSGNVEVYPGYFRASDIISFDNYPVAYGDADKLWLIPKGLDQLRAWGSGERPLMVILEAGFGDEVWANHHQQRAQVWMGINHGATSITWFCHRWAKVDGQNTMVSESMPLTNREVGNAIRKINMEIHGLAAVINSPVVADAVQADGADLSLSARRRDGALYVFAVERANKQGEATLKLNGVRNARAEVINEDRVLEVRDGVLTDSFTPFQTHLYKITPLP